MVAKKKKVTKPRVNKLSLWFKHYIDESNPQTFLNKTNSSIAAKYNATSYDSFAAIGYQNFKKLQSKVDEWLEDNKLSLSALKLKHSQLLETHKTVFQKIKGKVNEADLPEGAVIIAQGVKYMNDGDDAYDDGDTLLAIDVADPEVQRKSLDMAYKVKGLYAAEKREHFGKDGGPIETKMTDFPTEPATIAEWEEQRAIAEQRRIEDMGKADAQAPGP